MQPTGDWHWAWENLRLGPHPAIFANLGKLLRVPHAVPTTQASPLRQSWFLVLRSQRTTPDSPRHLAIACLASPSPRCNSAP